MSSHRSPAPPLPLSAKARRTHEAPISYLIATALRNPGLINLAAGLVDPATLPVKQTARIVQKILSDDARGRRALQYDNTIGLAELRQAALAHVEALESKPAADMSLTPDSVIVTTGSQQALYLIGDALIDPGDIVIAEAPSYFVYTGALTSLGARIVSVPIDEDGMDVAAVERTLANLAGRGELSRVKFIYCTSYFQNPTGLTLSLERRRRLYEVAKQFSRDHRIVVLEDAAYRELRYDGPALPSVKSFDAENRYTVLSQTFSKPFAPGIKLGYSLMPPDLMAACLHQKGNHDFGSANLTQHVAHEAMSDGTYVEQGQTLRAGYRKKRDLMLAALERHLPKDVAGIRCTHPHGGLYVWVTLPPAFDTSRTGPLFDAAVHAGVLYVPGDYCFQPDDRGEVPKNHLRLSFGQVHPDDIEPGVRKLCGVISAIASGSSHSSAA